ncbi:hypothetical protein KP509_04G047000 [Ceratopteris richardii]|uniref:Core-2/I-branching beta-1,6-N-acetylglucosaminyltransferase family protein n=1 Tax=Ceratopteris richardii TaxID=49495 RepID=A0A8T2V4H4_CERRI|nr:hypothetical protein KP509_04G047000 [Ceratopteris richardii]
MAKKKSAGHHRWRWKLGFSFAACILFLFVLKLRQNSLIGAHEATVPESELISLQAPDAVPNKIAFLFLARNRMPLDIIWGPFFQEARADLFTIYIHSRPGFVYDKRTTACSYFYGRQLSNSIQVEWGEASMIEAERLLLIEALKDSSNDRFLLLSDSFTDVKESRYNPKMAPIILKNKWRKGSQWFALKRDHAAVVASDAVVFPIFRKFCKRRPLLDSWRQKHLTGDPSKQHNCIPDEHYVQTLLAMKGLESEIERRTLTYTLWNQTNKEYEGAGWHPVTFKSADVDSELIGKIKAIMSVYYETEYRREWCSKNGTAQPCFLFARKFTRGAALGLLNQNIWNT